MMFILKKYESEKSIFHFIIFVFIRKYFCTAISDKDLRKTHMESAEKEYLFTKICEICLKSAQLDQELDVELELKKNG